MVKISVDKTTAKIAICRLYNIDYYDVGDVGRAEIVAVNTEITFDFEKGAE